MSATLQRGPDRSYFMSSTLSKWLCYGAFVLFVGGVVVFTSPKPDRFALDFGTLANGYSGLLAGLGGFAITVLAVILGLDALESKSNSRTHAAAYSAVLRQVSLSLTVASITCFVGALMLGEVVAQTSSVESARSRARGELEQHLKALGLSDSGVSSSLLEVDENFRRDPFFGSAMGVRSLVLSLAHDERLATKPSFRKLNERAEALDALLTGSTRRHALVTSVVALLSSLLILKSITFLVVVRFPTYKPIARLQDYVVLACGGMLLIKLLRLTSYGLSPHELTLGRYLILAMIVATILVYRSQLVRRVRALKSAVIRGEECGFTPSIPYVFAMTACFITLVYLAATFDFVSPPTLIDRALIAVLSTIGTALMITVQIERPTLELYVAADDLAR